MSTNNILIMNKDKYNQIRTEARTFDYIIAHNENGEKKKVYLDDIRFDSKLNIAYYLDFDKKDEDGDILKIYFEDFEIVERKKRKNNNNNNNSNANILIKPIGETEKAYILDAGSNNKVVRGNIKNYHKYVAKSICRIDEEGNIYAPYYAISDIL